MKKLLLSTALLGASALPALAQDQEIFREAPEAMEMRASNFMGMRLFASEAAVEGEEFEGAQEGWEDIGEINDIILDREGMVQAVIVDIGGFLGIGERQVAVSMDAIQFLSDSATAENAEDFFLVINASRETLEQAPEYQGIQAGEMTAEQAAEETDQTIEEGASDMAAAGAAAGAAVGEATEETAQVAEGAENAVEETGEEMADAGAEVADEAADAGEEVAEEASQADMTDTQEDQAEVADAQADAMEETAEETAQATDEAADESADQAEMTAEGTATETEMETDQTAEAATEEMATEEMAATDEAAATDEMATEDMAAAEMTDEEMAAAEQTSAETPARTPVAREGFVAAGVEDFTADRLQGAAVYDVNDERVGEVGEILLSEDGQVSDLVIDVGGFLGIGEKPVALAMDSVDILRQDGGEEIRVYVSQTEEELDSMERYEAQ